MSNVAAVFQHLARIQAQEFCQVKEMDNDHLQVVLATRSWCGLLAPRRTSFEKALAEQVDGSGEAGLGKAAGRAGEIDCEVNQEEHERLRTRWLF